MPLKGSLFKKKNGVFQLLTKFGPSVQAVTVDDLEVRVCNKIWVSPYKIRVVAECTLYQIYSTRRFNCNIIINCNCNAEIYEHQVLVHGFHFFLPSLV